MIFISLQSFHHSTAKGACPTTTEICNSILSPSPLAKLFGILESYNHKTSSFFSLSFVKDPFKTVCVFSETLS
jgi:hypothetical protein